MPFRAHPNTPRTAAQAPRGSIQPERSGRA